jgi:hypothetical protein
MNSIIHEVLVTADNVLHDDIHKSSVDSSYHPMAVDNESILKKFVNLHTGCQQYSLVKFGLICDSSNT